jgi:hypothetical protein
MPVSADPDDLLPYVLRTDRALPDPKPTFHLRYLVERKSARVDRLIDEARAITATDEVSDDRKKELLCEAINIGLAKMTGVRHEGKEVLVGEMSPRDHLSLFELWELANAVSGEPYLKEKERLGFASPRASAPASSAGTAPAAAPTNQV